MWHPVRLMSLQARSPRNRRSSNSNSSYNKGSRHRRLAHHGLQSHRHRHKVRSYIRVMDNRQLVRMVLYPHKAEEQAGSVVQLYQDEMHDRDGGVEVEVDE